MKLCIESQESREVKRSIRHEKNQIGKEVDMNLVRMNHLQEKINVSFAWTK